MQPEANWTIRLADRVEWGGLATKDGVFTVIYILFMNAKTGERNVARAEVPGEHQGLFERRVPEKGIAPAMDADEAQALADEAASVSDGRWMRSHWVTLRSDQPLTHRSGEERPADEIDPGDSVLLEPYRELLYVWDRWEKEDAGAIELTLGEEQEGKRFDVERKLLELERGIK